MSNLVAMKMPQKGEVFTHRHEDGTMRTFAVCMMQDFADLHAWHCKQIKCVRLPIDAGHVDHVKLNMGIEPARLDRLIEPYLSNPIIAIVWPEKEDGKDVITVIDGNHRLVKCLELGRQSINALLFHHELWGQFVINVPNPEERLTAPSGVIEAEQQRKGDQS